MCMEMLASMAGGQMKKQGQGMPGAQLPNMPGAAPVMTGTPTIGGGSGGGLLGDYAKQAIMGGPKVQDARAIGQMQPGDTEMLKKWDDLQPERSKDIDFETLLRLMRGQ